MAKTSLKESKSEALEVAEATADIIEGSPTGNMALSVSGTGIVGDLDASDIEFPKLGIAQGVGPLSENFRKGAIVLDGEFEISDGSKEVEFTVLRIGKFFEENIPFGEGEIPRIVTPAEQKEIGGTIIGHKDEDGNWVQPKWKPMADALICIKGGEPAEAFPFAHGDENYAFALWRIKRTAYEKGAKPIFSAAASYYRNGLKNGSFYLTTDKYQFGNNVVHGPKVKKGKIHDPKFVEWLSEFC
jgi:hypothetical protein